MRPVIAFVCLISALQVASPPSFAGESEVVAGEPMPPAIVLTPEYIDAHQQYQAAQLRWRQYRWQELPQQRQMLDQQIKLEEAKIRVLKRRARDYRPFLQVGRYSPARTAAQNDAISLLEVEQRLKRLRDERIYLTRAGRQQGQLYQLEVLRTAARVLELSPSRAPAAE